MIITRKKPFYRGLILLCLFFSIFYFLLTPVITIDGRKLTGLEYSDQVFNELSKGSSNFLPMAERAAASMKGCLISVTIPTKYPNQANILQRLLQNAQAKNINFANNHLSYKVDLGTLLSQATSDARLLYNNEEDRLLAKYSGFDPLQVASAWWNLLSPTATQLQIHNQQKESAAINTIIKRAIEPGNNYFGIPALQISQNIPLISAFLIFYIIYTIWYGFAIYEIFSGLGLMTSHSEEEICEE